MSGSWELERLCTANPGNQLATARTIGERLYVATRSASPFTVAAFDLRTNEVADAWELSIGDGPWPVTGCGAQASTTHGDDVYFGVYGVGDLYRLGTDRELSRLASFPDTWALWDLDAAADGTIYAGSFPDSRVLEYDPEDGSVIDRGSAHRDEDYARTVAVDGRTVLVGAGGKRARLIQLDRESGDRTDVLPSALRGRSMVDAIVPTEESIVASVRGRDADTSAALAVLDREDPNRHRIVERDGLVRFYGLVLHDGDVYVAARALRSSGTATVLYRYRLRDQTFEKVLTTPIEVGCCALTTAGDRLVAADDYGAVWTYDPVAGEFELTDLLAAGLPPRSELPQSLTVHGGKPVVAGHRKLHVHDESGGRRETARLPGEAKAMTSVDERAYAAVYKYAFFVEFGAAPAEPSVVAAVGHEQTRPRSIHYQPATGLVLMGTVPDSGKVGGAIAAYDPDTGDVTVDRGVVPGQSIRRVTSVDGTAFLASERRGGGGSDPGETEARVVAWDPVSREALWRCTPVSGARTITDLVPVDGELVGVTAGGRCFAVDPTVADTTAVGSLPVAPDESVGTCVVVDGFVYGVTDSRLYRVDPTTLAVTTVLDGLASTWYNEPMIAVDERDRLYLVDDGDLVRVTIG